jgi:uncharacterized protein
VFQIRKDVSQKKRLFSRIVQNPLICGKVFQMPSTEAKQLTKKEIKLFLLANKKQILNLGVARIGLFGSFVRGEQHPGSDIDILVEYQPGKKTYKNFITLAYFLEDSLHHKVELVTSTAVSPFILPFIEKEIEYVPLQN